MILRATSPKPTGRNCTGYTYQPKPVWSAQSVFADQVDVFCLPSVLLSAPLLVNHSSKSHGRTNCFHGLPDRFFYLRLSQMPLFGILWANPIFQGGSLTAKFNGFTSASLAFIFYFHNHKTTHGPDWFWLSRGYSFPFGTVRFGSITLKDAPPSTLHSWSIPAFLTLTLIRPSPHMALISW